MKSPLRIYTNPVTGSMVVGLPDGPPLKKFKKGQEAEAKEWAENVPGWKVSINRFSGKYSVDFYPHNASKAIHHPEFYSQGEALNYIHRKDPKATITVS